MQPNLAFQEADKWLTKQLQYQAAQRKKLSKYMENK